METKEAIRDIQQSATGFYKWAIGVLLSVVSFFMVMTYNKLNNIDANVQNLTTRDAVNTVNIEGSRQRINTLENRMEKVEDRVNAIEKQKR